MRRHINYYFLLLVTFLTGFGILFLAALSAPASLQVRGNTNYYLFNQVVKLAIGVVVGIVVFLLPLKFFKKISPALLIINLVLLALVFLPGLGTKFWGAQRWVSVGNFTFQPSEFLKITSILYLSALLSNRFSQTTKKSWAYSVKKSYYNFIRVFLPFLFLSGIIAVILIFQKDLSTLGIVSITLLAVYFAAGTPLWHTILSIIAGVGGVMALIKIEPYRVQRFLVFLNPETDPLGTGFQLKQSLLAIGSGGIFGKGLGMSTQKFGFLPQAISDSVFAILGEETGIIGTSILILLFLLFFWLGFKIANRAADKFSKLTAIGITIWITSQAFLNIASTISIFPISGIPLPFFSYGGSHLITEIIGVGILLNISKNG